MTVGTDQGNTYKGRQGTGFATIAPYDPQVDLSLLEMNQRKEQLAAQERAAKEKKLMDAYGQMAKIKPDNWYVHDKQVSGLVSGAIDLGASILQRGEDPFNGQSDEAVNFNKLLTETTKYTEYSKQFQKDFAEVQKAYKNGEEVENWDDIVTWFHNPDLIGMANGDYGIAPKPVFKKPEVSTFKTMNEYWEKWRLNNKERVPSMEDATLMARELTNDPTISQGFASSGSKLKQRFSELPKEQQEALAARGAANGGNDGYTQYVAEQMYALSNPNFSLEEEVMKLAKQVETSTSTVEEGATTTTSKYTKLSDKDMRKVVRSALQDGAVQREVQAGKYGNPNKDISFNLKAAEDFYLPLFKKNISTGYSRTEDEAGKEGKKTEASFTNWYNDITSGDGEKFVAAAPYLDKEALARFVPDMPKDSRIGNVKYYRSGKMDIVVVDKDGAEDFTRELRIGDIPKEMLKNAYMNQYKGTKRNYETTETGSTDSLYGSPKTTTTDNLY